MTVAALPVTQRRFASPPAARRSRKAMSTPPPQTLSRRRAHTRRPHHRHRDALGQNLGQAGQAEVLIVVALNMSPSRNEGIYEFRQSAQNYALPIDHDFMPPRGGCRCSTVLSVNRTWNLRLLPHRLSEAGSTRSWEANIGGAKNLILHLVRFGRSLVVDNPVDALDLVDDAGRGAA